MLIPELSGGLGNIMFQLASCYGIAKKTGHSFGFHVPPFPSSIHSTVNYNENILLPWSKYIINKESQIIVADKNAYPIKYDEFLKYPDSTIVQVKGTLQIHTYFSDYKDEIVPLFNLESDRINNSIYSDIDTAYFLHIRRGDYVNNAFHYIDLTNYYTKAINEFNNNLVYIFSNDLAWCEEWNLLKDKRCVFVNENEVDSLAIMAQCGKGGIASNSSFSWWGLFLNTNREKLIFPSRFFPHNILYQDGYKYYNYTIIDV